MFKIDLKAKLNQLINHTTLAYDLTYFSTYFNNQIERIKEMIKRKLKEKKLNIQHESRTENGRLGKITKST